MLIDWTLQVETQDGYAIFETDARIEINVNLENGEPFVEVLSFEIDVSRRVKGSLTQWETRKEPVIFSPSSADVWIGQLYLHVKDQLEQDDEFIEYAIEKWFDFYPLPYREFHQRRSLPFSISHPF